MQDTQRGIIISGVFLETLYCTDISSHMTYQVMSHDPQIPLETRDQARKMEEVCFTRQHKIGILIIYKSLFSEYHFTSREEMKRSVEEGNFIETAEFAGNVYGTRSVVNLQL